MKKWKQTCYDLFLQCAIFLENLYVPTAYVKMKTCHYGFEDHLETFEDIDLSRNLSNRKKRYSGFRSWGATTPV